MNIGKELRRARAERGLTLRRLAELGETSPAAVSQIENGGRGVTFDRIESLLFKTRHRLLVLPTLAPTVSEIADEISTYVLSGDARAAFRAVISYSDALRKEESGVQVALTLGGPVSTGSELYDAVLAALVEHWLSSNSLPIPGWVNDDSRFLAEATHLTESIYSVIPEKEEVPEAFLRRNVIFPAIALESV